MNKFQNCRRCVVAQLHWLIDNPTSSSSAGLTGYREELGTDDLFSVFVKFESQAGHAGPWASAKIFALAEEFEERLPRVGGALVLMAGSRVVAIAKVSAEGHEAI